MRFENQIALVVGSACGMGRETVLKLVREGATVVAYDMRDDELATLAEEVKGAPGAMIPFVGEAIDGAKRKECISLIKEKFGRLDLLAYVAGAYDFLCPLEETDDELWDYVINVNLSAPFRFARDAMPLLADHEGRSASIVVVASVGGYYGSIAGPAYVSSKHALLGLMKNLAYTYQGHNVRVNAVVPGTHATSITENAMIVWPDRDPINENGMEIFALGGANSINKIPALDPVGPANAICYLASDDAFSVSGAELKVDGGWTSF